MKNILFIIVFILSVFLISCTDSFKLDDTDIIAKDTFLLIIVDIQLADALHSHFAINNQDSKYNKGLLYLNILKKYNIPKERLKKTFEYYSADIEAFSVMLGEAILILEQKEKQNTLNKINTQ